MQETPLPEIFDSRDEPAAAGAPAVQPPAASTAVAKVDLLALAISRFGEWRAGAAALVERYRAVAFDLSTATGYAELTKAIAEVRAPRYAAQNVAKASKSELAVISKAVGAEEAAVTAFLDATEKRLVALRDAHDAKVAADKAEAARIEAERIAAHQAKIATIKSFLGRCQGLPAARIALGIEELQGQVYGDDWQEFAGLALDAKTETLEAMRILRAQTFDREAEAARIEAERKAEADRLAAQREDQARVAAEQAEAARHLAEQRDELARQQKVIADNMLRVTGLQGRIAEIRAAATGHEHATAADLAEAITAVTALDVSEGRFQELSGLAEMARTSTLAALRGLHFDAIERAGHASNDATARQLEAEVAAERARADAQCIAEEQRQHDAAIEHAERARHADAVTAAQTIAEKLPLAVAMGVIDPEHAKRIGALAANLTADFVIGNAAKYEPANLTLGTICGRLGFTISGAFLADELHVRPTSTDKRAQLYTEAQYQTICRQLQAHVGAMAELHEGKND